MPSDKPVELSYMYASRQLLQYEEGSPSWLFWRGVCIGRESPSVSEAWAEQVLRLALQGVRNAKR